MGQTPQITLVDKLMILPITARAIASALIASVTRLFSGASRPNTYMKDVIFAALRTNLSLMSVATEQWLNPATEATYLAFTKKQGFQPDTDVLSSGLKVHWLGPKTADKILLYFHGGGYVMSCSDGHFQWLFDLQNELSKSHSISVVVPAYTLAPHGQYPKQLQEAAESLAWLLDSQKKKPADIFLAGDSAGGNLALALLSHLLHPQPEVKNKIQLKEPLAGAILISPWGKFATDDDSVKRNASSDMVTPAAADRWSSLFLGPASLDNWNQPILADVAWFKGLDRQVKDILIWGGGGEVLVDSIEVIGKKLKEAFTKTQLVIEPGAAHEDMIISKLLGYKEKAEGTEVVENWIKARL